MSDMMYLRYLWGHFANDGLAGAICLSLFRLHTLSLLQGKGSSTIHYWAMPTSFHSVFCCRSTWNLPQIFLSKSSFCPSFSSLASWPISQAIVHCPWSYWGFYVGTLFLFIVKLASSSEAPSVWWNFPLIAIFQVCCCVKLWSKLVCLMLRFACQAKSRT